MDPGDLIATRYRLLEKIGQGGMGAVWRAKDQDIGRVVAMKQAHQAPDGRRSLRQMRQEARNVGAVDHPHVVRLFDLVVTEADGAWLVMEYVPSRNLAEVIKADGVLAADRVVAIGRALADALAAVHEQQIVHGDVKPENVLITLDGAVKLADFGISRAAWSRETHSGTIEAIGTPAYMAPEVARGAKPTPASDIFSLGATLFAAAKGRSPLGDGGPLNQIYRSAQDMVDAPSMPGALGSALSALLICDAGCRPGAAAVNGLLDGEIHSAPVDRGGAEGFARRLAHRCRDLRAAATHHKLRRRHVLVGGVAAGVLLLVGSLLVVLPRSSSAARARRKVPPVSRMGDPRSADPCALADPAVLKPFGDTQIATDYGNFNRCDEIVQRNGADLADVKIELETGPAPAPTAGDQLVRVGKIAVVREPAGNGECDQQLTLADGGFVPITAEQTGSGTVDLCAVATAVSDRAALVLGRGTVPRRAVPLPADSLASLNTCALLDAAALSRVPGMNPRHPENGFGSWDCRWNSTTNDTGIELRFDRNGPLDAAEDGRPEHYGGRQSFLQANGDGNGTCVARVAYRTYVDQDGQQTVELVYLEVAGSEPVTELCDQAGALASDAATRLPGAR